MSRYVIELRPDCKVVQQICEDGGRVYIGSKGKNNLEELTIDYIKKNYKSLLDEFYQNGFKDGKKEAESSEAIEQAKADAFNKGILFKEEKIHDAFLRGVEKGKQTAVGAAELREKLEYQKGFKDGKAIHEKGCEGCKYTVMGSDTTICTECCNAYYNKWTAMDDKIVVGDEVVMSDVGCEDITYTVVSFGEGTACGFTYDGIWTGWELNKVTKTGRHFDIDKILEEMKE